MTGLSLFRAKKRGGISTAPLVFRLKARLGEARNIQLARSCRVAARRNRLLDDSRKATRVKNKHTNKLVHDPALVELLDLMVLLHVERIHDWENANELRLSGKENLTLRNDD